MSLSSAGFLGLGLDELEELHDLLAVEALVEVEDLRPVLEEKEGQALDGDLVGVDGLSGAGEGEFLDADLELLVVAQEVRRTWRSGRSTKFLTVAWSLGKIFMAETVLARECKRSLAFSTRAASEVPAAVPAGGVFAI